MTEPCKKVPCFPDFTPITVDLKEALHPRLSLTSDGVSEFTFTGLYLFRNKYNYRISRNGDPEGGFIISGTQPAQAGQEAKTFFMTPCGAPEWDALEALFATHDYWKNISDSVLSPVREKLEERGIVFTEDRDNFDYLYYRKDLAELPGKKYHKKKNLIRQFLSAYPDYEHRQMSAETIPAAVEVLERWRKDTFADSGANSSASEGDYTAAKEALDLFNNLPLKGSVFYIGGKPSAYCLGESAARGRMFAIHFEKAIDEYKGIYQFMNQSFAAALPRFFTLVNREQDLGNEGLRQAKMTYRPCNFVRKYRGEKLEQ
ncbi:MAG: phosphatidylglycerol lysyltransferase domain-containing protein [Treponema sp.]|jgi:hypothetical protein|nr:phosphatidylglycerol lysyltransferase domain-containing protein [Treponema sp.]